MAHRSPGGISKHEAVTLSNYCYSTQHMSSWRSILLIESLLRPAPRKFVGLIPALPPRRLSMKVHLQAFPLLITALSIAAAGQCAKPGMSPIWDLAKGQFRCIDSSATTRSAQDDSVSPTGNKDFCKSARENLLRACPTSDEGKTCRNTAKSIFETCYKTTNARSDRGGTTSTSSQSSKTDPSVCMTTFTQQQQVCQSRKSQPRSPGQPYVPDTCLSDAMAAQNKCLANTR